MTWQQQQTIHSKSDNRRHQWTQNKNWTEEVFTECLKWTDPMRFWHCTWKNGESRCAINVQRHCNRAFLTQKLNALYTTSHLPTGWEMHLLTAAGADDDLSFPAFEEASWSHAPRGNSVDEHNLKQLKKKSYRGDTQCDGTSPHCTSCTNSN